MVSGKPLSQQVSILNNYAGSDKELILKAAENIAKAPRLINDDEARVYGALQSLKSRRNLGLLSIYFDKQLPLYLSNSWNVNDRTLYGYLSLFLNNAELSKCLQICKQLK
jgi:hypothetical protein